VLCAKQRDRLAFGSFIYWQRKNEKEINDKKANKKKQEQETQREGGNEGGGSRGGEGGGEYDRL
jgi:hypothetical protein